MLTATRKREGQEITMPSDSAPRQIRLVLTGLADGRTDGIPVGCYLARYDPDAHDGNGVAHWTPGQKQALTFATADEAISCYLSVPRNRPARPDGKPNRGPGRSDHRRHLLRTAPTA
jgi:hypothetical protein